MEEPWPLIGADIVLVCLAILLLSNLMSNLVALIVQRNTKTDKPEGISMELERK